MDFWQLLDFDVTKIVEFFARHNINVTASCIQRVIDVFISILAFCSVIAIIVLFFKKGKEIINLFSPKKYKWRHNLIKSRLEHYFGEYIQKENLNQYIETQCVSEPAYDFDEPDEVITAGPRESMLQMFDKIFSEKNTNRFLYCVLAGSGMGKTTFAVNLFCHYVCKYKEKTLPYDIYMFPLSDDNVLDNIANLSKDLGDDAHKTILILDALDESHQAIDDFGTFQRNLEEHIEPYKYVVITCRSQFFNSKDTEPEISSIKSYHSDKSLLRYNKLYISPFSDEDIQTYLRKKYKSRKKRKRAQAIINQCHNLMVRPLLLSYVEDLLDDYESYQNITVVYQKLIGKWIDRETNDITDEKERVSKFEDLMRFSSEIAIKMYENWSDSGDFTLTDEQMKSFIDKYDYQKVPYQFQQRSLLNRNANGRYKFAHKSFLEYFLAKEMFENPTFKIDFEGMDMANMFYHDFCTKEFNDLAGNDKFRLREFDNRKLIELRPVIRYNYDHLLFVNNLNIVCVRISLNAYMLSMQSFLDKTVASLLIIDDYQKGIVNLNNLIEKTGFRYLIINSHFERELPRNFIYKMQEKKILVFLNGILKTSVWESLENAPILIQMMVRQNFSRISVLSGSFGNFKN